MRRLMVLIVPVFLTACHDRRSFDERYNVTTNEIDERASALERQANTNLSQGNDEGGS